jgi:phosphoserine phosphatase
LILNEYGLGERDWVFVGDDANDVPIAKMAPLSVGYRPQAELANVVTDRIEDFDELLEVLARDQG